MAWILNPEDEHPLWRQYMDELEKMNPEEQRKWEYKWKYKWKYNDMTGVLAKSCVIYDHQDSFLRMLETDEEFNKRWGRLRCEVRQEKIEEIFDQKKQSN